MRNDETWARYLDTDTRSRIQSTGDFSPDLLVPGLTILCHPDPRRIGERTVLTDLTAMREVPVSRLEPLFAAPDASDRRPLADPYLSRRPFQIVPETEGGVILRPSGSQLEIAGERVETDYAVSAADLDEGVILLLARRVCLVLHQLPPSPPRNLPTFSMIGDSPKMIRLRQSLQQIGHLSAPVLLRGETGTGKELAARAVHSASSRRNRAYVPVNMAAIPPALAAAELFGASKGAYTGADARREGYFERAHGGTLFLDEIGDVPAEIQVALLRVLETQEVQPVGERQSRRVDVRVVAATDADLETKIESGDFRAPLLHRLGAYQLVLPPLRARRDDIGRLLVHFLRQELEDVQRADRLLPAEPGQNPWLGAPLVAHLAALPWPGNVRQLRNVARQLAASCHQDAEARIDRALEPHLRPAGMGDAPPRPSTDAPPTRQRKKYRRSEEVGEQELLDALQANRWRFQPTAAQLRVSRTALYGLLERFHIRKPSDLNRDEILACYERCRGDWEAMVDVLKVSRKGLKRRMTELGLP